MRIQTLVAGVCAAALIPTAALAQQTCEQRQSNRVAGTVVGAGVGAIAGSAIAGRGDRNEGAVIGGLAGALLGNQLSKGSQSQGDCSRAYGYYDNNGVWHANATARNNAQGYFDRNGNWVEGAPRGYYNGNQWVSADTDASSAGYYDSRGLWVPASAGGYYTNDGRWVAAAAPGYYDRSGRWIAGPATGRYDANGRWLAGQASGRRDANGVWISDPQPGYYDNGRWVRGEARGYYDARGRWISTDGRMDRANYGTSDDRDVRQRIERLDQRIRRGMDDGSLNRTEADQAIRTLASIRRDDRMLRNRNGNLRPRDEQMLTARLDRLSTALRIERQEQREYQREDQRQDRRY